MKLKSNLRVILAERNMKQLALLELMKEPISPGSLSGIVNGTIPKLETAADIAQALGLPIEQIWTPAEINSSGQTLN